MPLAWKKKPLVLGNLSAAIGANYLHTQIGLAVMAMLGFLTTWILTQLLQPGQIGQINLVLRVLQFALIPAVMGMDITVCRYTATALDKPNEKERVLALCSAILVFTSIAVALLTFGSFRAWPILQDPVARRLTSNLALMLPLVAGVDMLLGFIQGQKRMMAYGWMRALRQGILLALIAFGSLTWGFAAWPWVRVAGEALFLVLLIRVVGTGCFRQVFPDRQKIKEMLYFGGYAMVTSAMLSTLFFADFLFLDHVLGVNAIIGHYAVARTIIDGLSLVPMAMTKTLFPYTAELIHDRKRLLRFFVRSFCLMLLILGALTFLVAFLAGYIPFVFGDAYRPTVGYVRILSLGFLLQALGMLTRYTLLACGWARHNSLGAIFICAGNLLFLYLALVVWDGGATGACWATVATHGLSLLLYLIVLVYKEARHSSPAR